MRKIFTLAIVAAMFTTGIFQSVDAKKYTIYQRQAALNKRVSAAERAKELTFKEARNFREDLADIEKDKRKMITKNNGKLSYADEDKLEKRLNKVSVGIQNKKLEKRIQ